MKEFMGGEVKDGKWNAPVDIPIIRKSMKITTLPYKDKQTEYIFALCKISAKISRAPSSEQTDLMLVRCTKLTPVSAAGEQGSPFSRAVKDVTAES